MQTPASRSPGQSATVGRSSSGLLAFRAKTKQLLEASLVLELALTSTIRFLPCDGAEGSKSKPGRHTIAPKAKIPSSCHA